VYNAEFVPRLLTPLHTISPALGGLVWKFSFTNTASLFPSITEIVLEAVFVTYILLVALLTAVKRATKGNFILTGILANRLLFLLKEVFNSGFIVMLLLLFFIG
jgi:hypothetical protein